jgi:PAS domain S-box-containing protein
MPFEGIWEWDMYSDQVFCSDVMVSLEFLGTLGMVHPDDVQQLRKELKADPAPASLSFRMITSYGEVKKVVGENLRLQSPEDAHLTISLESRTVKEFQLLRQHDERLNRLQAYDFTEKVSRTGSWFTNLSTNETWYSDFVYHLHGLPANSLNAHPHTFHSFIHPDDISTVSEAYDLSYTQKIPLHLEYRIIAQDGTERKVLLITTWGHNEKGEEIFQGTMQDITALRDMEQQLEQAEAGLHFKGQLLAMAESNTNIGYWHLNLLTRKMVYSENCYRIFRIKPPTALGSSSTLFQSYVHPDDQELYQKSLEKIRKEHSVPDIQFRIVSPDGKTKHIRQKGKTIISEGEMLMAGTLQDITLQKALELQVTDLHSRLVMRDVRGRHAETIASMGSWLWNLTTGEMEWSDPLFEMMGYKPASIKPSDKIFLRSVHPEDQRRVRTEIDICIKEKTDVDLSVRLIRKSGMRNVRGLFRYVQQENEEFFVASFRDITDEHGSQQELKERVHLVEALGDSIPDIVLVTNADNTIVQWNKRSEQVFKMKKDDVIGQNFFDVFPYLKNEVMLGYFNTALNGDAVRLAEHKSQLVKGIFDVNLIPLKNDNGDTVGILHMLHDVTDEKHLHQELTGRLHFIEKLVEATVDRIIVLDRNMNYLYWNKRAEDYYGIPKEEVIGKNILELFPAFMNDPSYKELRNVLRGEIVHIPAEKNLQNKKGYFETYLIPVKANDGTVTSVLWIVHDLLKEYQLQRQKMKEHEVLDALSENYVELDSDYNIVNVNSSCADYLGRTEEELIGKSAWDVLNIGEGALRDAMLKAMEQGIFTRDEFPAPMTGNWLNVSIAPTIDGIVMLFYDNQQQRDIRRKLQETAAASPDAITIYNLQEKVPEYINDNLGKWLGYTSEEMLRMGYKGRLGLIHPADRDLVIQFNELLANTSDSDVRTLEYRLIKKNGDLTWVRNRTKVFQRNEHGVVTHTLSIVQDINQERKATGELEDLVRKLEARNKELERKQK